MAVDMFLKIDGIPGESTDARHRDEIDVLSYNWGESQPPTAGSAGGPAAGRVTMQDFHFAMRVNKASPKLFLACAGAAHIRNAILTVRRAGANPVEFLKWTLSNVTVASYQTASNMPAADPDPPLDQTSLRFAKIEVEYSAMRPDGSLDAPIKAGWDVQANTPV
jgi:type VI secretion system secreted protein Hcp